MDVKTNQDLRPNFSDFMEQLDLLVTCNRYDNQRAKIGMNVQDQPSPQEQREYMEPRLEELKFDFMPKSKNKVYHIVSAEWFTAWKKYVGLVKQELPEDGPKS